LVAASWCGCVSHRKILKFFRGEKKTGMELSTGKLLEENLLQSLRGIHIFSRTITNNTKSNLHGSCLPRRPGVFLSGQVTVLK
jgi:hypothetical protein